MKEQRKATTIRHLYDQQRSAYAEFSDKRFAWKYIEQPAFDTYITDLYSPEIRALDIGCGTGVVARHLISRGLLAKNIIGIDPSKGQITQAKKETPEVKFIQASGENFDIPNGSVDLVTTNTVLHHLDNTQLEAMLDKIYHVLTPDGTYFFVEVDPDHSEDGRNPHNTNTWTMVNTPWGTEVPFYNRDPHDLMDLLDKHGFEMVKGWVLSVSPQGAIEPENYTRYLSRPSRMAARFRKVSEEIRALRMQDTQIPSLIDQP